MVMLYDLTKYTFFLLLIGYPCLIVYAVLAKLNNRRLPLSHRTKQLLVAGPILLIILPICLFGLNQSASTERYASWKDKCGHDPVVETSDLYGMKDVHIGRGAKTEKDATGYYCTFLESGMHPISQPSKQDFISAGYYPDKDDLQFINKYRDLKYKLKF
jgi:hypothetical protein